MAVHVEPSQHAVPLWLRIVAAPLAIAVVLLGIWITGALITNDFRASMALTALWFAAVLVGAVVVWRHWPELRFPVSAVAVGTFVLVGGYLGLSSIRDVTVNETVATGAATLEGSFFGLAHPTEGTARIVEPAEGGRVLTLTGFRTDPGPDLYVYVTPGQTSGEDVDGSTRLARLKGNVGNQQYELPPKLYLSDGATVVIWCRSFTVSFGAAQLAAP